MEKQILESENLLKQKIASWAKPSPGTATTSATNNNKKGGDVTIIKQEAEGEKVKEQEVALALAHQVEAGEQKKNNISTSNTNSAIITKEVVDHVHDDQGSPELDPTKDLATLVWEKLYEPAVKHLLPQNKPKGTTALESGKNVH